MNGPIAKPDKIQNRNWPFPKTPLRQEHGRILRKVAGRELDSMGDTSTFG